MFSCIQLLQGMQSHHGKEIENSHIKFIFKLLFFHEKGNFKSCINFEIDKSHEFLPVVTTRNVPRALSPHLYFLY